MRIIRDERNWFQRLLWRWFNSILHPTLPIDAVPVFTTDQWVSQIDAALVNLPQQHCGSFWQRWCTMDDAEQRAWVERRKAALVIIWVRGGSNGLQGLGERLCGALADIDR